MSLYVIIPESIYDHGVIGVYTDRDAAQRAALAAHAVSDGYHSFRIEEWETNHLRLDRGPRLTASYNKTTTAPAVIQNVDWEEEGERR